MYTLLIGKFHLHQQQYVPKARTTVQPEPRPALAGGEPRPNPQFGRKQFPSSTVKSTMGSYSQSHGTINASALASLKKKLGHYIQGNTKLKETSLSPLYGKLVSEPLLINCQTLQNCQREKYEELMASRSGSTNFFPPKAILGVDEMRKIRRRGKNRLVH
ncbi:uncharacterized protein LOC144345912 [Saccoglossus kowalevskii]